MPRIAHQHKNLRDIRSNSCVKLKSADFMVKDGDPQYRTTFQNGTLQFHDELRYIMRFYFTSANNTNI